MVESYNVEDKQESNKYSRDRKCKSLRVKHTKSRLKKFGE